MSILAETPTIIQQLEDASSRLVLDETITELQIEMKSAVALAGEIKSENDDMKRQLESANAFSNANLQRHAEWKEVWKKDQEVRIGVRPITARPLETFDSTAPGPAWLGVKLEAAVLVGLNEARRVSSGSR